MISSSPSHSVILDIDDIIWNDYFNEYEMAEVRNCWDRSFDNPLPAALHEAIMKMNGKVS